MNQSPIITERRVTRDVSSLTVCSLVEVGACSSREAEGQRALLRIECKEEGTPGTHTYFLCARCATKLGELP
jgi:hypothetical protein